MKKTMFLLLIFAANKALAQVSSGTVVILNFTKDKLIVAADSRALSGKGDRPPDDSQCKISAFDGQTIFATVGAAFREKRSDVTPVGSWTNSDVARTSVKLAGPPTGDYRNRLQRIAATWGSILTTKWRSLYFWHPETVIRAAENGKGILTVGFFSEAHGGTIYWTVVGLNFDRAKIDAINFFIGDLNSCWPCGQGEGYRLCALGQVEVPAEFCSQSSERARDEAKRWTFSHSLLETRDRDELFTARVADLAIAYDVTQTIGGKIDMIEVGKDGSLRWIQRKDNCHEN